ncbi:g8483 [Coccomyxa elongata]
MAKIGEGDARWIVSEREDGANVNAWHWQEKDVLPWAKVRLQDLLGNQVLADSGSLSLKTGADVDVTGDAIINNRKKKLIPSYELQVKGTWSGEVRDGDTVESASGRFELPYVADENADEDPELKVSTSSDSAAARRLKEAFLGSGKQVFHEHMRTFVKELQAGGPSSSAASSKGALELPETDAAIKAKAEASRRELEAKKAAEAARRRAEDRASTGRVEMTERFYARPRDLFECFTDPGRVQAFTQSPAQVEPMVGGKFSIFGGSVDATFTALEAPSRIALDWRFKNWPDSVVSKVVLSLEEPQEGMTVLRLKQTGVPKEDRFGNGDVVESTAQGWKAQIFHRIRAVFGFGLGM